MEKNNLPISTQPAQGNVPDASEVSLDTSRENNTLSADLQKKYDSLLAQLKSYETLAVAFSGGVDSTLLLKVAHLALGQNVVAVTGRSLSIPQREIEEARAFCKEEGISHIVVDTNEFSLPGFDHNPSNRCYLCKKELFSCIARAAAARNIAVLAEGSNKDDEGDYRPGMQAIAELQVASPLRDAGFTKADVRTLARQLDLKAWDKPAFACLNSRFAYGDLITAEKLQRVDAAEEIIRRCGVKQVRVRVVGEAARIEVLPDDILRLAQSPVREEVVQALIDLGFSNVTLDLQGYRTGSMNATLADV